jgi:hypothetical protein
MDKPKEITKEWLRKRYHEISVQDLADELGVTKVTVYSLLDRAGIPRKGYRNRVVIVDE